MGALNHGALFAREELLDDVRLVRDAVGGVAGLVRESESEEVQCEPGALIVELPERGAPVIGAQLPPARGWSTGGIITVVILS